MVILSRRVRNVVVIGSVNFKPEHCKFWWNFEIDRNTICGADATAPSGHDLIVTSLSYQNDVVTTGNQYLRRFDFTIMSFEFDIFRHYDKILFLACN